MVHIGDVFTFILLITIRQNTIILKNWMGQKRANTTGICQLTSTYTGLVCSTFIILVLIINIY